MRSEDPQEDRSLPFLTDLSLSLAVLVSVNLRVLYTGKKITQVESEAFDKVVKK